MKIYSLNRTYSIDDDIDIKTALHQKYNLPMNSMHIYQCEDKNYVFFGSQIYENKTINTNEKENKAIDIEKYKKWFHSNQNEELIENDAKIIEYISKNTFETINYILNGDEEI